MVENNLSIIVFSKGRPMQMHAYLESLLKYSDAKEEMISVILCETKEIRYEKVKQNFPNVNWIMENNFEVNLKCAIKQAKKFIMFGCDDVVFVHPFSLEKACNYLDVKDQIFGFSIRLGKNILPFPENVIEDNGVFEWNWEETDAIGYDYPWELDCTVYRKEDVLRLLDEEKNAIKNPNFFEAIVSRDNRSEKLQKKYLACFAQKGNAIVITVNRVQDSHPNGFDDSMLTDIYTLDKVYNDEDNTLDIEKISQMNTNVVHVDAEFFILRKDREGFEKNRIENKRLQEIKQKIIYVYKKCYNFFERRVYKKDLYMKKVEVLSPMDTLKYLQEKNCSFARFGTDEFVLMQGMGVATQFYEESLAKRLEEVFDSNDEGFAVGIPHHFLRYHKYTDFFELFVLSVQNQRKYLRKICNYKSKYIDTGITQTYQIYNDLDFNKYFNEWKKILANRKVTLIVGEGIREKIEFNLLQECESVEYICVPSINAYDKYDEILSKAKTVTKDNLICVIAGPTAKVLVFDLFKEGYQAWDIGHLLKDYDAYMKKIERNKNEITQFYIPD